jgi:hypothetical protein
MLRGATPRAAEMVGTAVLRIVVSSDSMKKATATSHGKRRLEASDGPDKGGLTTCEADEFMSGKLEASFVRIIIMASEDAFLLEPGRYALSGYDVKVAISQENTQHRQGTESQLVPDGKPTGGSFAVAAGEIVYIGHFALDCTKEPIPWRYHINGSRDFERYVAGFRHAFPFIRDAPVHYRLFDTTQFGEAYTLVDDSANPDRAPKTHSP